jgi:hypothetical protein
VTQSLAKRTVEAGGASKRAAPRQSFTPPAACTAGYVSSASSPTMRRAMHRADAFSLACRYHRRRSIFIDATLQTSTPCPSEA